MAKTQESKMRKFTINRAIWRCGTGDYPNNTHGLGGTSLLNDEGYMCCLGMVCEQVGVPKSALFESTYPTNVNLDDYQDLIHLLRDGRSLSDLSANAIRINDDRFTTRTQKESLLKQEFLRHNYELEFVGEYNETPENLSACSS